ncbi:hypothetical protein ACLBOM_04935 [Escherichia coli]
MSRLGPKAFEQCAAAH